MFMEDSGECSPFSATPLTCWPPLVSHSPVRGVSTERTINRKMASSTLICQDRTVLRWHLPWKTSACTHQRKYVQLISLRLVWGESFNFNFSIASNQASQAGSNLPGSNWTISTSSGEQHPWLTCCWRYRTPHQSDKLAFGPTCMMLH